MSKRFDEILDECVSRINSGDSLEHCVARYPDHAEELEPLLKTIVEIQTPIQFIPSLRAKSIATQRFNNAMNKVENGREIRRPMFRMLPRWSAAFATVTAVLLIALIGYFAVIPALSPNGPGEEVLVHANFRLLISDEVNDIEDFEHLYVDITSIGIQQGNSSESWEILAPIPDPDDDGIPGIDLRLLTGENALEIWSGNVTPGVYSKMFIYVGNVTGYLVGNETVAVKLPSGKLHISKPFSVNDSLVNFVFDITVHEAGNSGKYILQPQISESGPDKDFNDVSPKKQGNSDPGQPEDAGKPADAGNGDPGQPVDAGEPENAGNDDPGQPVDAGEPEDAGNGDPGQPVDAGEPEDAGNDDPGQPVDAGKPENAGNSGNGKP